MEEDIKILEEFIELDRKIRENKVESDYEQFCERRCIAIENVLRERQLDKEKIKQLEEKLKGRTDNTNKLIEVTNLYLNSIPKSLIKEKIEELKETADEDNFIRIQVLEELLKETNANDKKRR